MSDRFPMIINSPYGSVTTGSIPEQLRQKLKNLTEVMI